MRFFVLATLIALLVPFSTGFQDGGGLVNAVIGNDPRIPSDSNETARIRAHLLSVAARLAIADVRALTPELQQARQRNLARLVEYARAGRFPDKPASIPGRIPNFLDADGARCAVGYLIEQDLGLTAVREIAAEHQFDYVPYIDSPVLASWQSTSGLTTTELAMIQPTYEFEKERHGKNSESRIAKAMLALEERGFAGQVVVARGSTRLLDAAYGYSDFADHLMVDQKTGFDVASVTKAFTAAAIFRLARDRRLLLTDTLGDLFPEAPLDKREITIEQLLGHTSGMGSTYAADGETDRTKAVAKLLAQPLSSVPGAKFKYSDDGYVVLAAIIEVASGGTYEQYMYGVVGPYVRATTFWGWGAPLADFTHPLDGTLTRPQWGQRGSGGLITTAQDLYRWTLDFLPGYVCPNVKELIAPRTQLGGDTAAGYGWFVSHPGTPEEVLWTRGNEDFGHNALIAIYRQTQNVLVVTSNRFSGEEPWSRRVQRELEPYLLQR